MRTILAVANETLTGPKLVARARDEDLLVLRHPALNHYRAAGRGRLVLWLVLAEGELRHLLDRLRLYWTWSS